ncbi:MAG: hypothetical protein A2289_05375 [Deltaproteobacteria bacterium RIFOXYA12_FULL_58_15]|nr:MAG: hypothetical protein A2289_05375 [Deltaproteobacteria bacterium RIFOXYA12_FULL_58_15]
MVGSMKQRYTTSQVARLLKLPEHRIRSYVRCGIISGGPDIGDEKQIHKASPQKPARSDANQKNRLSFDFRDILVLKTVRKLMSAGVPPNRVKQVLAAVRKQLPAERPLSAVRITLKDGVIVVSDGDVHWEPESGQSQLSFAAFDSPVHSQPSNPGSNPGTNPPVNPAVNPSSMAFGMMLGAKTGSMPNWVPGGSGDAPPHPVWFRAGNQPTLSEIIHSKKLSQGVPGAPNGTVKGGTLAINSADRWFNFGLDQEDSDPDGAYESYLRALAHNPEHVEAMINIGRLCSEGGDDTRAAAYFRQVIRVTPSHPVAHFNLAVTMHDQNNLDAALVSYKNALIQDPDFADAHFNLANLLEEIGDHEGATEHMKAYHHTTETRR